MWPIRLFAAVLLLPLAALAARTADGIARVVVARLRGALILRASRRGKTTG